jgi:mono/diheme cytochrome c family protein
MLTKILAAVAMLQTLLSSTALALDGEALFNDTCAACHQRGGIGSPGLAPPLADESLWERLGDAGPAYIVGVMLSGLSGSIDVNGEKYSGLVMPPQDRMSDDELAAIGSYVLSMLNKSSAKLIAATVAGARTAPPTHAELRSIRRANK